MLDVYEYILKCIEKRAIPSDKKITLKSYCEFYEKEIEHHVFEVEFKNGKKIFIKNEAKNIAHIMGIHAFYDRRFKDKALRFGGAFTGIDAYKNMKKGKITLNYLKKSKRGEAWNDDTKRIRVLSFPFMMKALREGEWYNFDINKFKGNTKLNPKIIVAYRLQKYILNFCISDSNDDNYFCISNIIAFKNDNPRVKNQDLLELDRVIELDSKGKVISCVCQNRLYRNYLRKTKEVEHVTVNEKKHEELISKKCFVNTNKIAHDKYEVVYLKLDTNTKKFIEK
jgi:hypothetical protein